MLRYEKNKIEALLLKDYQALDRVWLSCYDWFYIKGRISAFEAVLKR